MAFYARHFWVQSITRLVDEQLLQFHVTIHRHPQKYACFMLSGWSSAPCKSWAIQQAKDVYAGVAVFFPDLNLQQI